MSKSKRNTVDPTDIIDTYGADTARWFMLSDSPPERDVIWTEDGVQGAWRFVQRVWRSDRRSYAEKERTARRSSTGGFRQRPLNCDARATRPWPPFPTIWKRLGFNRAVARLYELVNTISKSLSDGMSMIRGTEYAVREAADYLVQMMAPMMPHLAEECWHVLGHDNLISEAKWPVADPDC